MNLLEKKDNGESIQNETADYASKFLIKNEIKERSCVYISKKVHATISKIVKMTSASDITVGGYIDSIIIEHIETHKKEIIKMYNKELARNKSAKLIEF
jgi:hypothetical protein